MPEEPSAAAPPLRPIKKLMAANRSEIAIRVFRSTHELGVRTVAIYAHEDRFALHRFKADEAYQVGNPGQPLRAYLDIDNIVALAKQHDVDAIHPGYGFLSENPAFARACRDAGLIFVGPPPEAMEEMGEKTRARRKVSGAGVPIVPGLTEPIAEGAEEKAKRYAKQIGYPIMLKA